MGSRYHGCDSYETFVNVEVREESPRIEKIFRAFVMGPPDNPKNGLIEESVSKGYIAYVIKMLQHALRLGLISV
jgi:hypothetical protein